MLLRHFEKIHPKVKKLVLLEALKGDQNRAFFLFLLLKRNISVNFEDRVEVGKRWCRTLLEAYSPVGIADSKGVWCVASGITSFIFCRTVRVTSG